MSTATRRARTKRTVSHAARAEAYARRVTEGRVVACRFVRLACQRHLDDLARQERPRFAYRFDVAAADRVCRFLELLPHVKGNWALRAERIKLEDWQCFIVCVAFGWVRKSDGRRRFRRGYVEVPRKNAKSTLSAGLGLYMLAADGEHGAEVYSGAGTEKQAHEVFAPARLMARNTAALCAELGIHVGAKNLSVFETASKFEPIIGKPGDGASPSFSITDEYHEHLTSEQYDTMLTGMGAREQPMAWVITTAGSDTAGPCYALRSEVVEMLEGKVENDQLFGIVFTIDEDVDWTSELALRMANPNMGVSVFEDYLRGQQRDAVNDPRKQSVFKTKHGNIWVTAASPYFNIELWNRNADPSLDRDQFRGEACWSGLDLAAKLDLTAAVQVFRREIEGADHYFAFLRAYIPEERAQDPACRHYDGWVTAGHLIATPGNVTDYDQVEADLIEDSERHRIVSLGYDPFNATQLVEHLSKSGVPCVETPQTVRHLSEPMKWVEALIVDGRLHHDGNPVFAWGMGNVTAQIDRNENVFPRKERADKKIDPAVALIIAIGAAFRDPPKPQGSWRPQ